MVGTIMVGTMMVGTMMVGTMMVGTMMVGTMMVGTMMVGTMMVGTMMRMRMTVVVSMLRPTLRLTLMPTSMLLLQRATFWDNYNLEHLHCKLPEKLCHHKSLALL